MFLLAYPAMAQDEPYAGISGTVKEQNEDSQSDTDPQGSESDWDRMYDETVYERYGSTESPAFLNRENINPNESDYGYEGAN